MKLKSTDLLQYIRENPYEKVVRMAEYFRVSKVTLHAHLRKLIDSGNLMKQGKTPFVRYIPVKKTSTDSEGGINFSKGIQRLLVQERYQIAKNGDELLGSTGFVTWCKKRGIDAFIGSQRRSTHIYHVDSLMTEYGIDASIKLDSYGADVLQKLWYGSIYALPEFGKTRMGTYMDIAKTHPNPQTFSQLLQETIHYIKNIILEYDIQALCFASPTAHRSLQLMSFLRKHVSEQTGLGVIPLIKLPGFFPAQKTLKKMQDRIENAQSSFGIQKYEKTHDNILIIDDAVGSGATLVEIGRKIISRGIAKNCYGFALVGTANGVISGVKKFEVLASV